MREIAAVDSDPSAFQRSKFQELGVSVRHRVPAHRTKWRLHNAEHDRHIRYAAAHRASRILAVGDRNDSVLRDEANSRFEAEVEIVSRRTNNGAVRVRSDCGCA